MRFIVVDDEPYARKQILHLTSAYSDLECIAQVKNGIEAVEAIEEYQPDLVFLDIQMPGLNGFDVIRQIKPDKKPIIVFITAYDEYALKAFDVEALDYLIKPVSEDRFRSMVEKLRKHQLTSAVHMKNAIINASKSINDPLTRLPVRVGRRIKLKTFSEVYWFDLEDRIVFAQTDEGRFPTHFDSLKELEDRLYQQEFFRINRIHLINLAHISEIVPFGQYRLQILLKDHADIPLRVSRDQSRKLKKIIGF